MDELYEAVLKGVRAGKTLAQLQDEVRMVDYKDWFNYDKQLKLNIEGMFNQIGLHRRGN